MAVSPGIRLLPNALTVLALCSGLSGVQFMLSGNAMAAVGAIALAAVFDALDGRVARLLDATSRMGAELDSLSDCVSFGVSPALILFLWSLHEIRIGWVVALVLAVSAALRLARFNTLSDDDEAPPFASEFFVGVPSPAGALVALTPLAFSLAVGGPGWWSSPIVVSVWTIGCGALMISRVPTLSLKSVKVPQRLVAVLLVAIAFAAAALVIFPFIGYTALVVLFLLHVPYAVSRYRWLARHPEVWHVPPRQRRAVRRAHRRLGLAPPRRPLRRRVAGAAARAGSAARNISRADRTDRRDNGDRRGPGGNRRLGLRRQRMRRPDRPETDRTVRDRGERPARERPQRAPGQGEPGHGEPGPGAPDRRRPGPREPGRRDPDGGDR